MNPTDRLTSDSPLQATDSPSLSEYRLRSLDSVRERLPQVARELAAIGVARVLLSYDGCGDDGQIEGVQYFSADGEPLDLLSKVAFSQETLRALFYDLLEERQPGWETGDGAWGEFEWNLATDRLHHTHKNRFTDFDVTEYEGL